MKPRYITIKESSETKFNNRINEAYLEGYEVQHFHSASSTGAGSVVLSAIMCYKYAMHDKHPEEMKQIANFKIGD